MSVSEEGDVDERAAQQKREWRFVADCFCIVASFILIILAFERGWLPPTDHLGLPAKYPYWLAVVGTLVGAIGASSPEIVKPVSHWRDRCALYGWGIVFVGALIALLYGVQLNKWK